MKKINRAYLADKDETIEEFVSKIPPEELNGEFIFGDLDIETAQKALEQLSEDHEDVHPAMFIPQLFILSKTPSEAFQLLTGQNKKKDGIYLGDFLDEVVSKIHYWLSLNTKLLDELTTLYGIPRVEQLAGGFFQLTNYNPTPETDKKYISQGKTNAEQTKRLKVLAALDVSLQYALLKNARKNNETDTASAHMFFFVRSLAQFSAATSVKEGLNVKPRRIKGGLAKSDRVGLFALITHFHENNPGASNKVLWKKIRIALQKEPFKTPCGEYEVSFRTDPNEKEYLVQTKDDDEYPIGFEAFKKIRKRVRS